MFAYIWPLGLVVLSNVFYQIAAKSVPGGLDPFASLTITYVVGALISFMMFLAIGKGGNIFHELPKANWAPFVMGLAVVGLEVGYIYVYKAGWPISSAQIIQAAVLAIILIFVGYFAYHEKLTWNKIVGIIVCIGGLALINYK